MLESSGWRGTRVVLEKDKGSDWRGTRGCPGEGQGVRLERVEGSGWRVLTASSRKRDEKSDWAEAMQRTKESRGSGLTGKRTPAGEGRGIRLDADEISDWRRTRINLEGRRIRLERN